MAVKIVTQNIYDAIEQGDLEALKHHLEQESYPRDTKDKLFVFCVKSGHLPLVKFMHEEKIADINFPEHPVGLSDALIAEHYDIIDYFLKQGANLDKVCDMAQGSVMTGNIQTVDHLRNILTRYGDDVVEKDIHEFVKYAASQNNVLMIHYLIEYQGYAPQEQKDILETARINKKSEVIEYFADLDTVESIARGDLECPARPKFQTIDDLHIERVNYDAKGMPGSGFAAMALSRRFSDVMQCHRSQDGRLLTTQDLKKWGLLSMPNEHLLSLTGQLKTIFNAQYWPLKNPNVIEHFDNLFNGLSPENQKHVQADYKMARAEMQIANISASRPAPRLKRRIKQKGRTL